MYTDENIIYRLVDPKRRISLPSLVMDPKLQADDQWP